MARHLKQGVDFVPIDVDFFDDNKYFLLQEKYPCKGFSYLMSIWVEIYKSSYYLEWDQTTQIKFCRRINVKLSDFQEVLNYIIEIDLLSSDLYEKHNILTSAGIQSRWVKAVKRRKSVVMIREFILIRQQEIDAVRATGLLIETLAGELEDLPKRKRVKTYPEPEQPQGSDGGDEDIPVSPPSDYEIGAHTIEFIRDFVKVPYEERTQEFKDMWKRDYYVSYQGFSNLIIAEYKTFHKSEFHISLPQYKKLYIQLKWTKEQLVDALNKMSASGNIHRDTDMANRLKMYLESIIKQSNQRQSVTHKVIKPTILHDSTTNKTYNG